MTWNCFMSMWLWNDMQSCELFDIIRWFYEHIWHILRVLSCSFKNSTQTTDSQDNHAEKTICPSVKDSKSISPLVLGECAGSLLRNLLNTTLHQPASGLHPLKRPYCPCQPHPSIKSMLYQKIKTMSMCLFRKPELSCDAIRFDLFFDDKTCSKSGLTE